MAQFPFLPDHNRLIEERYAKVDALRAAGIDPYPARHEASHVAADVLADPDRLIADGTTVSLLGRAMMIRSFGKAAFMPVRDRSGTLQVYVKSGEVDDLGFRIYKEFLDAGDLVWAEGTIMRTKTGEVTLLAKTFRLAAKSVRPLPEKWHGLSDVELRYRQRYVDLIVNPEVKETFRKRSRILSTLRRILDDRGFMEVETPMMQSLYGGAAARPFITHHNTLDMRLFLRIAPELYLKRLVVGGLDRVYEINRNFRNEGISTQHNPEFTMLEAYVGGLNAARLMELAEDILREAIVAVHGSTTVTLPPRKGATEGETVDFARFERVTIIEAVRRHAGFDVRWDMSLDEIRAACPGVHWPKEMQGTADAIMFLIDEFVEEKLVAPTFITEFPKAISPLAKSIPGRPDTTDRFELYINGMELANGFSELNDPRDQYDRFAEQVERRRRGDEEAVGQIDEDYVRALEYGMVPTAGIGIGIDRLVMILTDSASIRDVILFPLMKPHEAQHNTGEEESPLTPHESGSGI